MNTIKDLILQIQNLEEKRKRLEGTEQFHEAKLEEIQTKIGNLEKKIHDNKKTSDQFSPILEMWRDAEAATLKLISTYREQLSNLDQTMVPLKQQLQDESEAEKLINKASKAETLADYE